MTYTDLKLLDFKLKQGAHLYLRLTRKTHNLSLQQKYTHTHTLHLYVRLGEHLNSIKCSQICSWCDIFLHWFVCLRWHFQCSQTHVCYSCLAFGWENTFQDSLLKTPGAPHTFISEDVCYKLIALILDQMLWLAFAVTLYRKLHLFRKGLIKCETSCNVCSL